jgi:hypothetical protein
MWIYLKLNVTCDLAIVYSYYFCSNKKNIKTEIMPDK